MTHYRTATAQELTQILQWARAEGWNPGLDDATAFYAADPIGTFVAEVDETIIAAITVVNHNDDFAFLGLYLCQPDWRGKGIGFALWSFALDHAQSRIVGLDGVAAQQANYAKSGFVRQGATRRYCGHIAPEPGLGIRRISPGDIPACLTLDTASNGFARPDFMTAWLTETDSRYTVVLDHGQGPDGLATIRRCEDGVKIGPVIAPDTDSAMTLIRAALHECPAQTLYLDLPDVAHGLAARLHVLGFKVTFETARMYRGTAPLPGPHLHAIATMELG
ncbi:GNAT family N-acetyltransferase [Thioclava sp. SK-1]|uniref:GNAT family N-acetyltransferase n=1 Tax=Thioclava sp. SK-1 TaxID=1889770 RepID=UPI00082620BB|nr:GNAT family N-acetyltransferase [Thioclava sp. SK-1]OCX66807.1 GNAT family N-acetyltransferase [Thioclava sp. SK-1]